MGDSSADKPVIEWTPTINVESEAHGNLRLRKWLVKDSTAIRHLCQEELEPREFAERLLVQQAVEPALTPDQLKGWTDAELTTIAIKWWLGTEGGGASLIAIDSLGGLQAAVHRRNDEHTESLPSIPFEMNAARMHGFNSNDRIASYLAKQNSLLHFGAPGSVQRIIERAELAGSFSTIVDKIRDLRSVFPDRLGFASIQERIREAQLLSMPSALKLSRFAEESSSAYGLTSRTAELARQMSDRLRPFESMLDSNLMRGTLRSLDATAYGRFLPDVGAFESVVSGFGTSWIDRIAPEISLTSIARMAALMGAAHAANPFDLSSVATLRAALGDWRDVTMPWRFLADTSLREDFYIEHGFDTSLIQLPEPAFTRALESVGLVRRPLAPVAVEFDEVHEEDLLRHRMSEVYNLLFRLERALRDYIHRMMTEKIGPAWERQRCHGNGKIYQLWVQKRDKAVQNGLKPERLVEYADFTEYADLITRADNWDEMFKDAFGRPECVRESFHRLGAVRLCTMHARPITKTEVMLAIAEITRLLIAIGAEEND